VDTQCAFPFIFEEEGFNDCASVESDALGITLDKFNASTGDFTKPLLLACA
jgi:hypothetical protein